jgi:hypothetical protein
VVMNFFFLLFFFINWHTYVMCGSSTFFCTRYETMNMLGFLSEMGCIGISVTRVMRSSNGESRECW